jgi:hypothetical protein
VKKDKLEMAIVKQGHSGELVVTVSFLPPAPAKNAPFCKFVNAVLVGMPSQEGVEGNQATVLLENPTGNGVQDLQQLNDQVRSPGVVDTMHDRFIKNHCFKFMYFDLLIHFYVVGSLDKYFSV